MSTYKRNFFSIVILLFTAAVSAAVPISAKKNCLQSVALLNVSAESLKFDFAARDALPQTTLPQESWDSCCGPWGPWPAAYPAVEPPAAFKGDLTWLRERAVTVALKYLGLPYLHRHIPSLGGLDCSNFSAWVYNYGFGIRIFSNIEKQSETAGRKLTAAENLERGDLLFIWSADHARISHVVIYVGNGKIIDSTNSENPTGVQVRDFDGWYKNRFAWARRLLE